MWSNFLDSRQPPGTKALHSISVMDWFLQEAKLMQSISVIQLVSASHSSQSRWHQPGSTMKIQGKCASLMLASWSSPQPGFEGPWGGCHRTSAQVGNFPQPLMSAALTAAIKSLHFSLPHKPHTLPLLTPCLTQKDFFLLLPFVHRQLISLLLILVICNHGVPCFAHTRSAFCRRGNCLNPSAKPSQQQQHGSHSESPGRSQSLFKFWSRQRALQELSL